MIENIWIDSTFDRDRVSYLRDISKKILFNLLGKFTLVSEIPVLMLKEMGLFSEEGLPLIKTGVRRKIFLEMILDKLFLKTWEITDEENIFTKIKGFEPSK